MLLRAKRSLIYCAADKESVFGHRRASFKLTPAVKLNVLDLNGITVEGRGVGRFWVDRNNAFVIQGTGLQVNDVNVSISHGEVVSVMYAATDVVEVVYKVNEDHIHEDVIEITIRIADGLHSVHPARLCYELSPAAACSYYLNCPRLCQQWFYVLQDNSHHRGVILAACDRLYLYGPAILAVMEAATSFHLQDQLVQVKTLTSVMFSPVIDEPENAQSVCAFIYAAMDAHRTCVRIQANGCWVISKMAQTSAKHKRILLEGRAMEVCFRARDLAPSESIKTIAALQP